MNSVGNIFSFSKNIHMLLVLSILINFEKIVQFFLSKVIGVKIDKVIKQKIKRNGTFNRLVKNIYFH